jgi:hypothetical protein
MGSQQAGPAGNEPYKVEMYDFDNPPEHFHKSRQLIIRSWASKWRYEEMQSLLWNITSRRHHRDFPRSQRELLYSAGLIGREEVEMLPVEEAMFNVSSFIFGDLIMNTVENYNITETAILERKSKQPIKETNIKSCHGSFIIVPVRADGYRSLYLKVYNCSDVPQPFVVTDYYLKSLRSDVQSLTLELSRKLCEEYSSVISGR